MLSHLSSIDEKHEQIYFILPQKKHTKKKNKESEKFRNCDRKMTKQHMQAQGLILFQDLLFADKND